MQYSPADENVNAYKRLLYGLLCTLVVCLFVTTFFPQKAAAQCGFDALGDYTCGGGLGQNNGGYNNSNTGGGNNNIYNDTVIPILQQSPLCGSALLAALNVLPSPIVDALSVHIANILNRSQASGGADIVCDILDSVGQIGQVVVSAGTCGPIPTYNANDDVQADFEYAYQVMVYNVIAQQIALDSMLSTSGQTSLTAQRVCDSVPPPPPSTLPGNGGSAGGGSGGVDPNAPQRPTVPAATPTGEWCDSVQASSGADSPPLGSAEQQPLSGGCADNIVTSAINSLGASTANIPGTQEGALGCAAAVTNILECAGQGVGFTLGTGVLYDSLENSGCYEKVCSGYLSDCDLEPGDVLVTARGSRAGHTGVYVGSDSGMGNEIISNSSSGFQGSARGTVQANYSTEAWDRGVTTRNPSKSAVFRCSC